MSNSDTLRYVPRLKSVYLEERDAFMKKIGVKNIMEVPKLSKVVVTMGERNISSDKKVLEDVFEDLYIITGQKPVVTRAKKSIAGFKLRQGMPMGCKVTLRSNMMYEFLDKLINIALPSVRDFRGLRKSQCDGSSCLSLGLKEHVVFPEVDFDKVDKVRGMNIVIVTTSKTAENTCALLDLLGMPFFA